GYLAEALKLDPDDPETHDNLGVTLAQLGQMNDAIAHFKKALELNTSYETARYHLSIAMEAMEK
ncbi:MAG: tetratricopeptide repeat protein, partial [Deltaproteobacteria bacterium]|nr:tetratricopeptide repeat protein [Deltaproteobacteria bacterium]